MVLIRHRLGRRRGTPNSSVRAALVLDYHPTTMAMPLSVAFIAALPLAVPARAVPDNPRLTQIREVLEAKRQKLHIPGLAFALVVDGKVFALDALGVRDIENKLPATPDTVFPIGSCTKAFTAMAAVIADGEGVLSLDDSPRRFLPWFKMQDPEANELVTLRDMLSHRTGLQGYADLAELGGVLSRVEVLRAAVGARPSAKLRARYQYSNTMVTAAGEAVARAYRSTWNKVIETKILAPLGMTSTLTSAVAIDQAQDHATGYEYDPGAGTWRPSPLGRRLETQAPAGAIISSARDMAEWVRLLTGGGKLADKQIVPEAGLRDMITPHTPIGGNASYALGWLVHDHNGRRVVEHNGGSAGLSAVMAFMPERRAGFVILANSSPTALTEIGRAGGLLWPILLGDKPVVPKPAAAPPRPSPSPPSPPPGEGPGTLPSADDLLARMIRAGGGARNMRRHATMRVRAATVYEHQGVRSEITISAGDPNRRVEDEVFIASGKHIGRIRIWFDGSRGGQQTTFGQDAAFGPDEVAAARRDDLLHPLLDLKASYKTVSVDRKVSAGGEDAYLVSLVPASGKTVQLTVAARTALVVGRTIDAQLTTFGDFRMIDGEVVPFAVTVKNELGEQTIKVKDVRFGVPMPEPTFAAVKVLRR